MGKITSLPEVQKLISLYPDILESVFEKANDYNELVKSSVYLISKKIIYQDDFTKHFGDFNEPEIIEKALTLIDASELNKKILELFNSDLITGIKKLHGFNPEPELISSFTHNESIMLLKKSVNELK